MLTNCTKSTLSLFTSPALGEGLDSFVQCPPEALSWSRRKYLILEEILSYRPHILCLQEVDHYFDTLQPVLASLGYSSNFCPKPWSPCLDVEGNNGPDGCALFFDQMRYDFLDSVNIRLSAMKIPTNQVGWRRMRLFVDCWAGPTLTRCFLTVGCRGDNVAVQEHREMHLRGRDAPEGSIRLGVASQRTGC